MTDPQQIHRAAQSLRRAIAPGQDDFGHPDHGDLVAFADGKLGDVDREIVETHVAICAQCGEDLRDVREMRELMSAEPKPVSHTWKYIVAAGAVAAAVLVLVVVLRKPEQQAVTKEASLSPAPSASPRESGLSSEEQTAVDAAIASGRVDVPSSVRALQGSVGQLLGSNTATAALLPMSPSGTAVAFASPQLSWRAISGAVSYHVAVFDETFREVASSGPLKVTNWTPTAELPANVSLAWQVTARMADGSSVMAPAPPNPEARFVVLDRATAAAIADRRAKLADQPLALGILLAKAGLVEDAAREFERAASQPALADAAAKLRASLRSPQ